MVGSLCRSVVSVKSVFRAIRSIRGVRVSLRMRHAILTALLLSQALVAQSPAPGGFAAGSLESQAKAEKVFLDTVTPASARKWLAALTEEPHVAGTPAEKKLADYVLARFKEFGLAAEIVRYDVFLNHPRDVSLKLLADATAVRGLASMPRDYDPSIRQDLFVIRITGRGMWELAHGDTTLMRVEFGMPRLPRPTLLRPRSHAQWKSWRRRPSSPSTPTRNCRSCLRPRQYQFFDHNRSLRNRRVALNNCVPS